MALGYISKLYAIERELRDGSDAERYQGRQTRSVPLLAEFKSWLDDNVGKVMKGSLTRNPLIALMSLSHPPWCSTLWTLLIVTGSVCLIALR